LTTFATFSPNRLFVPLGSNITEGTFSVPDTNGTAPATVAGFGVVFADVDLANTSSLQFFDSGGSSLGTFAVPGHPMAACPFSASSSRPSASRGCVS